MPGCERATRSHVEKDLMEPASLWGWPALLHGLRPGLLLFVAVAASMTLTSIALAQTTVRFRLLDTSTGRTTPAMVCITGTSEGEVRIPPDGEVVEKPSRTDTFYRGIRFEEGPNWIGPVRKTMGRGDNDDRAFVYELRPSIPYWREPVMYQTSGDFTIDLPAGRWRVAVEHGMEFIPVVEEFTTDGDGDMTRTIDLTRWIDMKKRGWWSGDVHVHHPLLEPAHRAFLIQYAIAADLHMVNVLEMGHHQGTDFKQEGFGEEHRVREGDYCLVAGQEEPRSTFGHIIGLNLQHFVRAEDMSEYDLYDLVFRRIHQQDGTLVGFAHFAWNGCDLPRGFPWYVTTGDLDFVELLQFGLLNRMDYHKYLNLGFRLTAAAGSDIPWGSHLGEVRTYVHTGPKLDIDAWFDALKRGRSFVTNGPMLEFTVDEELPGAELKRTRGDRVSIRARALSHPAIGTLKSLTLVGNEGTIGEAANPDGKQELSITLERPIERSQWLAVAAVCDNEAVAHTTPVYVVVDDRPTWCAERAPRIIQEQLEAIEKIAVEFRDDPSDRGREVRHRLDRARTFYADLHARIGVP